MTLFEGTYDPKRFLKAVQGLEEEPEKRERRCVFASVCGWRRRPVAERRDLMNSRRHFPSARTKIPAGLTPSVTNWRRTCLLPFSTRVLKRKTDFAGLWNCQRSTASIGRITAAVFFPSGIKRMRKLDAEASGRGKRRCGGNSSSRPQKQDRAACGVSEEKRV